MLTLKVVSPCLPKPRVISWYNCKVSADHLLPSLEAYSAYTGRAWNSTVWRVVSMRTPLKFVLVMEKLHFLRLRKSWNLSVNIEKVV